MISQRRLPLWIAILLPGLVPVALAADFTPPAEGPVAFRRDKIPLDADQIAGLSRQLETLARGLDAQTPADRRGAAQMLALAVSLDPANASARQLIADYQSGGHEPDENTAKLETSRARIWQLIGWLETPDAGSQGQALASCLKDVMVIADPGNPKVAALKQSGEKGAWAGWIPALSAYQAKSAAEPVAPAKTTPDTGPADSAAGPALDKARVFTLLWQRVGKSEPPVWTQAVEPLEMTAKLSVRQHDGESGVEQPSISPFSVRIGPGGGDPSLKQLENSITGILKNHHGSLPHGVRVTINNPEFERSLASQKRHSLSAAAAVLASAAISGSDPDAVILGQLDDNGAYKLPTAFWDKLQALGKGGGQRLVLPAESAPYLMSVLALERPEFFIQYEVLLAADFKQLLACCARIPEPPLAEATAEFRKIRERSGSQDVRQYIANSFVKQRLSAVLQNAPNHASAKLLLIQAAGSRPTTVARAVLAAEIRRALEPMASISRVTDRELSNSETSSLGRVFDLCRSKLDPLERYAEKNDAALVAQARDVVGLVRSLEKATRTRGESYTVQAAVTTARGDLNRRYKEFAEQLAAEIGDPAAGANR